MLCSASEGHPFSLGLFYLPPPPPLLSAANFRLTLKQQTVQTFQEE